MSTCVFNPALETSAKIILPRFPGVEFATQRFNFPEFRAVFPQHYYPGQSLHQPPAGVEYGEWVLEFIVNASLDNYRSIVEWMQEAPTMPLNEVFSDATVVFTDGLKRPTGLTAKFSDVMPYHISPLQYQTNVQDPQPLVAVASFKYTKFNFT